MRHHKSHKEQATSFLFIREGRAGLTELAEPCSWPERGPRTQQGTQDIAAKLLRQPLSTPSSRHGLGCQRKTKGTSWNPSTPRTSPPSCEGCSHTSNPKPTALMAWMRGPPKQRQRETSIRGRARETPVLGFRGEEGEGYRHDLLIISNSLHPRHLPLRLVGGQILREKTERSDANLIWSGRPFSTVPRDGCAQRRSLKPLNAISSSPQASTEL